MSMGTFVLRTVVVAIAMFALGFLGHRLLLGPDYVAIEPIMRNKADMQSQHALRLHYDVLLFRGFCVDLSKGRGNCFWPGQRVCFGIAIWALASVAAWAKGDSRILQGGTF